MCSSKITSYIPEREGGRGERERERGYNITNCYFLVAQVRDAHFSSSINHNATYTGFTPLHYAVITDNKDIIQLLLENG